MLPFEDEFYPHMYLLNLGSHDTISMKVLKLSLSHKCVVCEKVPMFLPGPGCLEVSVLSWCFGTSLVVFTLWGADLLKRRVFHKTVP